MSLPKAETLTFTRTIAAAPAKVFAAVASAEARKEWTRPNASINIIYEQEDFRPGGRDVSLCGPKGQETVRVDLLYERIEDGKLVVYTERLGPKADPISVAIVSMKMTGEASTELEVVVQIVALTVDVVDGYREGTGMALDNLKAMFD